MGIAVGNTLEALTAVWLLRRVARFDNKLARIKDVLAFLVAAAIIGTAVSATIGVTSLGLGNVQSWSKFGTLWRVWWLGDAVGALVVAPVALTWATWRPGAPQSERPGEVLSLLGVSAVVNLVIFAGLLNFIATNHPLEYAVFPFIIWAAVRFGQWGTASVTAIMSGIAIWGTVNGLGPFSKGDMGENLVLLQTFVAAVAATGLLLGAALAERDRVADTVRESEERYRDLFENASDIIYSHDLHGNMTSFSRAGEQILGYSRDEMMQKNITQILAPRSAELARSMTARKVAQGGRTTYELEAIARDGHLVCVEINSRLILKDGKPVGVQGVARDVTERKRADAALRESEERLRLALDAGHCGVWDWDIPGNRVTWSERTYEIHGVTPGTFGGTVEAFTALVHPEDEPKVSEAIRRAVEEGVPTVASFESSAPAAKCAGSRRAGGFFRTPRGNQRACWAPF